MRVRAIDANNDWEFGKGKNDYRADAVAIQQSVKTRLQAFIGDCFFAQDQGIDWFNLLGSKNKTELSLAISSVILNTQGVTKIIDFTFDLDDNRNALISYKIETSYGIIKDNLELFSVPEEEEKHYLLTEDGGILLQESGYGILLE